MNAPAHLIDVTLNGSPRSVAAGQSVAALLAALGLDPRLVVVEHNRAILARDQLAGTQVAHGDVLEVVHFVGGG